MLQSLATFGAGVFTGQSLQTCRTSLPQCSITEDQARLLLRCHGVNVPALPAPGVLSRQRPQLCVRLGAAEKQTEPGDFTNGSLSLLKSSEQECNWRFGDVMTFFVTADDMLQGLRFRLLSKTDFRFGPVQMELAQTVELGAGSLDLREALLQCAPVQPAFAAPMNTNPWESPILHLDLMEMQSGCPRDVAATASVSLSFLADPSWLLQEAEKAERPLFKRMADPCLDPCSHCANANTSRGGGFPQTSFAEPDSEKSPDSEYKTCEVPSYLYNSWSPHNGHYEAWAEAASPAGRAEHFVWPGARPRSRDAETLCTTGLRGFSGGKQGLQKPQRGRSGLGPSTSLPQPLVVKLRLQQPVPSPRSELADDFAT
ncbi:ilvE [Symbiodinium pilosum]|uniref:IlvE protein n=1 Tax=Symbiodinium pilosum TaxID=2952 RepID=A0A812NXD9_SYMPI|nr:ilvE [Symbiodinium pilosum]